MRADLDRRLSDASIYLQGLSALWLVLADHLVHGDPLNEDLTGSLALMASNQLDRIREALDEAHGELMRAGKEGSDDA